MGLPVMLGLDIGQRREPSGLCVAELDERDDDRHYLVRHLERLPAGTNFPTIAERVGQVATGIRRHRNCRPQAYVDVTGLGETIIDLLYDEEHLGTIFSVYFTYGDQRTVEGRQVRLGKAFLVSRLQVLLQSKRLHLPRTQQAEELAQDLNDFEIEIDEKANERYGAFPVGRHDELVTALGLAVHCEPRRAGIY